LLRGLGELIAGRLQRTNLTSETIYSLFALTIGLLFLIGGMKKWKFTAETKTTNRQQEFSKKSGFSAKLNI